MCNYSEKKIHKDTQKTLNRHVEDSLELPGHPDGDQKTQIHFLSTAMVLRTTKRYHMCNYSEKKNHQDTQNPLNHHLEDILELPDHPDSDQKTQIHFPSTAMVLRITKRYHMLGHSDPN